MEHKQRKRFWPPDNKAHREGSGDRHPQGKHWKNGVMPNIPRQSKQLLHLVFGGALRSVSDDIEFKDPEKLDFVGIYPNYASAYAAWRAKAQGTVDNAEMRYFIVHLHRLLDPTGLPSSTSVDD